MASEKVTGKTEDELEELRLDYYSRPDTWTEDAADFEEKYCLAKIGKQPEDYDGPVRYCTKSGSDLHEFGGNTLCRFHGTGTPIQEQGLDPHVEHGVHAASQNLRGDFDKKDRALYDWIVSSYSKTYDLGIDENPGIAYDLHRLAVEIVRAERGRGHLLSEGEVKEEPVRNEEGHIVTDEQGNVVTEKSEHYLAKMMNRQDNKITKLEKELGITRKEKLRRDQTDSAIDAVKGFAELGSAFVDRDSKDYDPENKPWEEDEQD